MDFYINNIVEKTDYNRTQVEEIIEQKKRAFNGAVNDTVAASMVSNDLKVDLEDYKDPEIIEQPTKTEKLDITIASTNQPLTSSNQGLFPSEAEVLFLINRRKFVKEKLIDASDKMMISGQPFLKKSAWRKYINAFGISISIISEKLTEKVDDVVAEYRIKAMTPNGQFVVADGTKSKSEYYSERYKNFGSYTLHNLKATARTRAINIAVSDLVGYGETSAEELNEKVIQAKAKIEEVLPEKDFEFDFSKKQKGG